jgi:hypothetical protein
MISEGPNILSYGKPDPRWKRLVRLIPRLSIWTVLLLLAATLAATWVWFDHEPWKIQHTFGRAASTLPDSFSSDERFLLIGDDRGHSVSEGPFQVIDVDTRRVVCTIGKSNDLVGNVAFSPAGNRLLIALMDARSLRDSRGFELRPALFDTATGSKIADLPEMKRSFRRERAVKQMRFSADGTRFICLDGDNVNLHDAMDGKLVAPIVHDNPGSVEDAWFSPNSNILVTWGKSHRFFDAKSGRQLGQFVFDSRTGRGDFSPDSKWFTIADKKISLVDRTIEPDNGRSSASVKLQMTGSKGKPEWSPDGKQLLVHEEYACYIFDAKTMNKIAHLRRGLGAFGAHILSPDGTRAAVADSDGRINIVRFFDGHTWQETGVIADPMEVRQGPFADALFIRDAKHLITSTDGGITRLWVLRRSEAKWGLIQLPQGWLTVVMTIGFVVFLIRDLVRWWR